MALASRSQFAELALVNGAGGVDVVPRSRLLLALTFTDDNIAAYDVISDPARLQQLELAFLNDGPAPSTSRRETPSLGARCRSYSLLIDPSCYSSSSSALAGSRKGRSP